MQQSHSYNVIILEFIVALVGDWKEWSTTEHQLQDFSDYSLKYISILCGLCMHKETPAALQPVE